MRRVIFFGYTESLGLTYHLTFLARELKKNFDDVIVVNNGMEQNKGLKDALHEDGIEVIENDVDIISSYCNDEAVIHCHGIKQLNIVENILRDKKSKVVLTLHAYRNSTKLKNFVIFYLIHRYKFVSKWVFQTYYSYLDFKRVGFKGAFDIIPLGMEECNNIQRETEYFDIKEKKNFKYSDDDFYVFYGAQFYKHKRHEELLISMSSILKNKKQVKLMLCGDGPEIDNIYKLGKSLEISSSIKFLGRVDRWVYLNHLSNASISIVTSKTETFGHNILEPLLLGVPVVSTPVGIAPEIIFDYVNGFIFEVDDSRKLTLAVDYFIDSNVGFDTEYLKSQFSWERCAQSYLACYKSLFKE